MRRVALGVIRVLAPMVPRAMRARWLEEWLAEIDHAAAALGDRRFGSLRVLRMSLGALADVAAIRRVNRASPSTPDPSRSPGHMFNGLMQDVRYALRVLTAAPAFAVGVIGSLTLGIAVNAAAFAIINAMFLQSLPGIEGPQRVVRLELCRVQHGNCFWETSSYDDYVLMRDSLKTVAGLSARVGTQVAGRLRGEALTLRAAFVSPNYFDVFKARLPLGRGFAPSETNEPVAIISHTLWQRRFQENRSILGEYIDIGPVSMRIVGVAPDGFLGATSAGDGREVWIPFGLMSAATLPPRPSWFGGPHQGQYLIEHVGRLAPDASLDLVRAEAQVFSAALGARRPDPQGGYGARVCRFGPRRCPSNDRVLEALGVIMPLPLLVLGIACLNAASLMLARATYRMRETTVRLALGATRWRITRYVLIESSLLALAAGALSVPVTKWAMRIAEPMMPVSMPIDWRVLGFTAAIAAAAALLVGFVPALRASSGSLALGSSRPGDSGALAPRFRHALVLVQVAASLGLLATGTQSISAVSTLIATTGADDPERLLLASFDLDHLKMRPEQGQEFYRQLLERVGHLPQVEAAGLAPATGLWTFGRGIGSAPLFVWRPDDDPKKGSLYHGGSAAGRLFDAVGLQVIEGRGFGPEDAATARPRVAIVNQPLAERIFGGTGVLGRSIRVSATRRHEDSVDVQIVGVIEPTIEWSYSRKPVPAIYVPAPLQYEPALTLYVRSRTPLADLVPDVRQAVAATDPRVPFVELASLRTRMEHRNVEERVLALGATILGAVALVLATAGLYGLFSFIVSLRQREIGVRMALGAEPSAVLRLVLRQAMRLALWGSAIGGLIAMVAGAIVNANLVGMPSIDPLMFLASAGILLLAMLAAGFIPARRAARVDPIVVLRQE